ncbi:hypothetical protein FisN_9Lh304 [Fistulifera solaris]|uniref:Uncharacterized protein n=1 Tax=Fistulifera solaris TaxID=1519565 RepID=A0A1Z5KLI7_FISSO|nr:hypothetical protein FisN_9Lh304 [Fistulifera solaris]|eukprot:GAX26995.1 hypothetical protein FisN_9Lh304 [Fistulifera solaris]
MFLLLLDKISQSNFMTTLVIVIALYAMQEMKALNEQVNSFGAGAAPDLRMGFTSDELNQWYDDMGEQGQQAYLQMAAWDFCPFMVITPILIGTYLYGQLAAAGMSPNAAMMMTVAMVCDLLETYIVVYGCKHYPKEKLPDHYVELASVGNQLKWILYVSGLMLLTVLFLYNTLRPHKPEEAEKKTE